MQSWKSRTPAIDSAGNPWYLRAIEQLAPQASGGNIYGIRKITISRISSVLIWITYDSQSISIVFWTATTR